MAASSRLRGGAAALLAAAALAACSSPTAIDTHAAAITNGADDSGDPAVVALLQGTTLLCTATLIAPRVLLSAAHCFSDDGALPAAHFGAVPGAGDVTVALQLARRHPAFDATVLDNDVAVALLAEDAPAGTPPAPLPSVPLDGSDVGTTLRIVGFGRTAADDTTPPRKRAGTAIVSSLEADAFSFTPSPSQTCEGDSGGPAFATVGAAGAVVGVTSSGDPACATMARDMRVDAYLGGFIAPFVAATAVGAAQAGDRCYYPANCAAGAGECLPALDDATLSFCAPPCGAGCPAGLACLADGNGVARCRHAAPSPGAAGSACTVAADCEGGRACVAAAGGGGRVCADTCFPDLPGFCAASFECRPVAGGGGSACFVKSHGGCSFLPAPSAAPWPLGLLVALVALSVRSDGRRARRAAAGTRLPSRRR